MVSVVSAVAACLSKEVGFTVFGMLIVAEVLAEIRHQAAVATFPAASFADGLSVVAVSVLAVLNPKRTSLYSVLMILCIGAAIIAWRVHLNGEHALYRWTILENHIALLPSATERALSYGQSHFWYWWKLLYPRYLCFDYGFACIPMVTSLLDWRNALPLVTYGIMLYGIYYAVRHLRVGLLFGLALWIVSLVPALNIVFPVGTVLAERLLFIPSLGYCIVASDLLCNEGAEMIVAARAWFEHQQLDPVAAANVTPQKSPKRKKGKAAMDPKLANARNLVLALLLPVFGAFTTIILNRNADWTSEYSIYRSALAVCPSSVKALSNFAMLAMANEENELAAECALKALSLNPNQTSALINAGLANMKLNKFPESVELLERVAREDPLNGRAHGYLGGALFSWFREVPMEAQETEVLHQNALMHLENAIKIGFRPPAIYHKAASLYYDLQALDVAIDYYETAVRLSNELRMSRYGHLNAVVEDDINAGFTYNQLGNAYMALGNSSKAIEAFELGLSRAPGTYQIHANLGILYRDRGDMQKGRKTLLSGIEIAPDDTKLVMYNNLGLLELEDRQFKVALQYFEKAFHGVQKAKKQIVESATNEQVLRIIEENIVKAKTGQMESQGKQP